MSTTTLATAPRSMGRLPIFWLHYQQNGGTWITTVAQAHGERFLRPHLRSHGRNLPNYLNETCRRPRSCKLKAADITLQNATFTAIERAFDRSVELCTGSFLYGTAIMHPRLFLHSALRHRPGMDPSQMLEVLHGARVPERQHAHDLCWGDPYPVRGDNDVKLDGQYNHYDNYYVRGLNGFSAFWLPPGNVTRAHFMAAVEVLHRFDVILLLDELHLHLDQLVHTFRWQRSIIERPAVSSNNHRYTPNWMNWTDSQTAWLLELNRWDLELYEIARSRARQLSKAAAHAAAEGRAERPHP